jgi:SAM-dependent methyltransferase
MGPKTGRYRLERRPEGWYAVAPSPSREELRDFYADVYYQTQASSSYQADYDEEERAHIDLRSRHLIHALALAGVAPPGRRRLLEIGAGEGFFLDAAQKAGFEVEGVDFSSHGLERFNPHLLPRVSIGDAYDLLDWIVAAGETRDVVVLQNVLEHVVDPDRLMDGIRRVLSPGGAVVIRVPNDYSPLQLDGIRRGHFDREFWFGPPQHLNYFTPASLSAFCTACGFEVCDRFGDFPIDWFLYHPGSNYVVDKSNGKAAHRARVAIELLMSRAGIAAYHQHARSLAEVGMGRVCVVVAKPTGHGA